MTEQELKDAKENKEALGLCNPAVAHILREVGAKNCVVYEGGGKWFRIN